MTSDTQQTRSDRPIISVSEAADILSVSRSRAYRLAAAGVLPGLIVRPGFRQMVSRAALENARDSGEWPSA
jgi:excisionase family DNA binding protein